MWTQQELLYGVALPLVVSLGVLLLFGAKRAGVALAFGAAYLAGHIGLTGKPTWPVPSAEQWVPLIAVAAAAVGMLVSGRFSSEGATWLGRVVLVLLALNTLLISQAKQSWNGAEAFVWAQAIMGVWLVVWWSVDELAERVQGVTVPAVMSLSVGASALLILLGGSDRLGKYAVVLAAAVFAAVLAVWVRRGVTLATGGMAVIFVVWGSLLLCALFYSYGFEKREWCVLAVALSPILGWVRTSRAVQAMSPPLALLATLLMVAIPIVAAMTPLAIKAYQTMR